MKTRSQIVSQANQQKQEIDQYFADVNHWNRYVRKPMDPMIDADPGGRLRKIFAALSRMLECEKVTTFKCRDCDNEIQFVGDQWEHVALGQRHCAVLENDV